MKEEGLIYILVQAASVLLMGLNFEEHYSRQ